MEQSRVPCRKFVPDCRPLAPETLASLLLRESFLHARGHLARVVYSFWFSSTCTFPATSSVSECHPSRPTSLRTKHAHRAMQDLYTHATLQGFCWAVICLVSRACGAQRAGELLQHDLNWMKVGIMRRCCRISLLAASPDEACAHWPLKWLQTLVC
eukprot:1156645-Pelagomonas_calceolata.AAC.4